MNATPETQAGWGMACVGATLALVCLAPGLAAAQGPAGEHWLAWDKDPAAWTPRKEQLQAYGEQFPDAMALYEALKKDAGEPTVLTWEDMGKPEYDWSGIFTRTRGGLSYDPDVTPDVNTAPLTEAGTAALNKKIEHIARTGGEYDPISDCRPPGFPRWLTEPFLHEYIVTPTQTWLINEMVNDVRRVYTDGRDHTAPEDAYESWNGDTIGFWDKDVLVTHTTYLMPGQYQRGTQPNYSGKIEAVERWRKVDPITLEADVWLFDPENLAKPWYTRQSWTELENDDTALRIRYWDCRENTNNAIVVEPDGTSQFGTFTFTANESAPADGAAAAGDAAATPAADASPTPAP